MENKKEIVWAEFHPNRNKWHGIKVIMGQKGSHENYDVLYNGSCDGYYFDTKEEAEKAAKIGINKLL